MKIITPANSLSAAEAVDGLERYLAGLTYSRTAFQARNGLEGWMKFAGIDLPALGYGVAEQAMSEQAMHVVFARRP